MRTRHLRSGGNPTGCPADTPGTRVACEYAQANGLDIPAGCDCPGGGFGYGFEARAVYGSSPNNTITEWKAGDVVEAGWVIQANHGGGYSYRLCKRTGSVSDLTEECFHQVGEGWVPVSVP